MRIRSLPVILLALGAACASTIVAGPLEEAGSDFPEITSVDSAKYPPQNISVKLPKDAYTVLILVAPGHSAALLFPRDSTTDNKLTAGTHDIAIQIPGPLILTDSARKARVELQRQRFDSAGRARARTSAPATTAMPPLMPDAPTYVLAVTSPHPLAYSKVFEKTAGWSIPLDDMEALNAVAKQVKSTITQSPRDWGAAYHVIILAQPKK